MSDRASFLRAIRASPDDDTLRLVFADWLDEHGEPALAEFVRVQVELEPIRDQLDNPRVGELQHRESVLLELHGSDWLGSVRDIEAEYPGFGPVFRRGLPELVCLSLDTFLKRGGELFAACPTVREVSLFDVAGRGAELAACPYLAHVETLDIADIVYTVLTSGSAALCGALRAARVYRLRLPGVYPVLSGDLLNSLGRAIVTGWPRWVEFVQLHPYHRDTGAWEEAVAALDRIAGRPVTRIIRPFENRFPLLGCLGHGFWAGHFGRPGQFPGGTPALVVPYNPGEVMMQAFAPDGSVGGYFLTACPHDVVPQVLGRELGFTPGLIRVREVEQTYEGLSVHLWPRSYVENYLQNPFERPAGWSDREWRNRGGVLRRWLQQGRFVIEWDGKDFWADASGTIFSA
jgi:uncharacterized protein (TIGR02996 family)